MAITLNPPDANAILLSGGGWQAIAPGTLEFGTLEIEDEASVFGFRADVGDGRIVTGRLSALIAVLTAAPE